ncbi:MAG: replication restart helicase PriA, partial [Candidatus Dormibacteraceae bacterium]
GSSSAIFAPLEQLGLICLDEEGSSSYHQNRTPRYEASWVAAQLTELTGAKLVLSSATPSLNAWHRAAQGKLALAELPRRVWGWPARLEVVDMREEVRSNNRLPLSRRLIEAVDLALNRREQVILLLNRRGSATFILCRGCGQTIGCPGCSVSLVQHPELGGLACHYCGYVQGLPERCPSCGCSMPRAMGMGTQRLSGAVTKLWPQARVLRLDSDALRVPEAYWNIFEQFADHQADVLVGTQMVARGLDLEGVSTVGVIDADIQLRFPDYRAVESAFSLITQVAGRAGRRERPGRVVVQSSNPEHFAITAAATGDYRAMAASELAMRRAFRFPPLSEMVTLTYRHSDENLALERVEAAVEQVGSGLALDEVGGIEVQGPSPAYPHRLRGEYRWQLILKGEGLARA